MDSTRPRRLLLPAVVYALILALSSVPGSSINPLGLPAVFSYLGHAIEYGLLGAALAWALIAPGVGPDRQPDRERDLTRIVVVVAVVVAILGGIDELYQGTVPGRETSLVDLAVDVVAACVAATIVGSGARRRGG